jgi:hypothetical protein
MNNAEYTHIAEATITKIRTSTISTRNQTKSTSELFYLLSYFQKSFLEVFSYPLTPVE